MLRDRTINRAALRSIPAIVLGVAILCALPALSHAGPSLRGSTSCSSWPTGSSQSADATGSNVICNGTDWEYPGYIVGDTGTGGSAPSCSSSNAGMLVWSGSAIQYCNGSSLASLQTASDANLAFLDASQSFSKRQAVTPVAEGTQSAGGTLTLDFSASNNFTATFGAGNLTIANPTNMSAGQCGFLALTQDSTGGRTVTWGSDWHWAGGTAPTLSTAANALDVISYCTSSTSYIDGNLAMANVQ